MDERGRTRSIEIASVFKALGHPTRSYIVESLGDGERCVNELTDLIGVDVSTVSRHLAVLRDAGVITSRKDGTTVYYSLACDCLSQMIDGVENVIRQKMRRHSTALTR